jgi:nucleoside-diphosphate-sugar epimerase
MLLDVSKLKELGWRPRFNSVEAVRLTLKETLRKLGGL